jgi:hypothetical protein
MLAPVTHRRYRSAISAHVDQQAIVLRNAKPRSSIEQPHDPEEAERDRPD